MADGINWGQYSDLANQAQQYSEAPTTDNQPIQMPTSAGVLSPTTNETVGRAIEYGLPGLGAGFLDTLGQSLHIIDNKAVPDAINNLTGGAPGSFGDFYQQNQAPLRMGGEIAGFMLPGKVMMDGLKSVNGIREAGSLGAWAKNSTALDLLFGSSADMAASEKAISSAVTDAAGQQGIWAGRTVSTPAMIAAKRTFYAKKAVDAARTTVAFELGSYAAFNSSQTFYPADVTLWDQAKWAGLGLATGEALELAQARYAVRQITQAALRGSSQSTETSLSLYGKDADKVMFRPNNRGIGVTAYAAMDQDLRNTIAVNDNPAVLQTNLKQDQVNIKKVLSEQVYQMGYDTHPILPRTTLDNDQIQVALGALKKNPTALMTANKIAAVPPDLKEFYDGITETLAKAKGAYDVADFAAQSKFGLNTPEYFDAIQKAHADLAPIQKAADEFHYVLEPTGDWTVFKNRAANWLDNNSLSSIKYKPYTTPNPANAEVPLKNTKLISTGTPVVLHDNGRFELPQSPTPNDYSAAYAMGSKLIKNWKPVEGQQLIMTPGVNWRTLEIQSALAKQYPAAQQAVKLGGDFSSLDDVDFHVLNQKFKGFLKDMPDTNTAPITNNASLLSKLTSLGKNLTPAQVLQKYNLPTQDVFNDAPVTEMFAHAKLQGMDDLNDMFPKPNGGNAYNQPYTQMDLVRKHLQQIATPAETPGADSAALQAGGQTATTPQPAWQGNLLSQTSDAKPLFVAAKGVPLTDLADANITGRLQAMRDIQLEKLGQINQSTSPLLQNIIGKIISTGPEGGDLSGAANQARAVQTLQDGILSGTGQVVYQDRINEQFPTLKALQLIAQDGDKYSDAYVTNLSSQKMSPMIADILSAKNKPDLIDFNRIEQSYRFGWDINGIVPSPNGAGKGYAYTLNPDSKINKQLIAMHFPGTEIDDGAQLFMPDMSVTARKAGYFPLTVSKNASDLSQEISNLSRQSGAENNALRTALGKNPITIRDFHLPTPELNKEGTWFVYNPQGRVISTYTGPNFKANELRAQSAATSFGEGHVAVPLETVKMDHQINDDNFFNLIDYSDQLAKTGTAIKGGLAHAEVDTGPLTLQSMVRSLKEQYLNIGIRGRAAIFEPELNYAKQAADTATASTRNNLGATNIFDRYIATMFSRSPNTSKGAIGAVYGGIENGLDRALTATYAHFTALSDMDSNKIGSAIVNTLLRKQTPDKEFAQYAKQAADWSPFKDTEDWRESTLREKTPPSIRALSGQLSRLSSTMSLRFLDLGTAINHFAGLMTNSPSVITALRQMPGESFDNWISRTAAWGTKLTPGVTSFSPLKALSNTAKAYWKGELDAPMQDAAKHGYFQPEYASLYHALMLPPKSSQRAFTNFVSYATRAADNSEMLSRQIAWGMGYKIGKELHQFDDEKNSYIFANNFVNEMIGNYSPNNKPAMFQGAVGLPLGAFQTWMTNVYRRTYGYVERGDKASILAQYAAQASVFGARSVQGYSAWNSLFQSSDNKDDDFTSRVERGFAPGVGELLLNGTLSNIPKIWGGLQGDGLSFYTRGGIDYTQPVPTLLDMSKAPPIQFLTDTVKGISATLQNLFSSSGFSLQQQEEIMANFTTNRAIRSIMEQAADAKTDQRGNVIQYGTHNAFNIAAGLLGTQPSSVRSMQEASQRQRDVQLAQEDARETLSAHTKSILRGGNVSVSQLQGVVQDYIHSGGNIAYLGQWFRNELLTSTDPRTDKELQSLATSGKMLEFEDMLASMQQNSKNPIEPRRQ